MKRKPLIAMSIFFFSLFFMGSVSAFGGNLTVNDSESANITVNISSITMVDITPSDFAWTGVYPGDVGDSSDEQKGGYYAIQIENIGSRNITHVWFNASYPGYNPFGTGNNSADAGNFVVLSKNTSSNEFWFINRVEYNTTAELVYLRDPDNNMPPDASHYIYGRYHNASNEYFWMIDNATECNATGTLIYVGENPHSKTQTGSTDFTNASSDIDSFQLTNYKDYGYTDITTGPLNGLCVAVDHTCTRVFFSKWNADAPFHLCNNVNYAYDYNETGTPTPLVPGDSFAMSIKVYIPYGIYAGSTTGEITAIVNHIA